MIAMSHYKVFDQTLTGSCGKPFWIIHVNDFYPDGRIKESLSIVEPPKLEQCSMQIKLIRQGTFNWTLEGTEDDNRSKATKKVSGTLTPTYIDPVILDYARGREEGSEQARG